MYNNVYTLVEINIMLNNKFAESDHNYIQSNILYHGVEFLVLIIYTGRRDPVKGYAIVFIYIVENY